MKMRSILALIFVVAVAGCKSPEAPTVNDDTIVSSDVNGVTLVHRHAVSAPAQFKSVNEEYRALYPASVMSRPDFGGKVIRTLNAGQPYMALGQVENDWLALADAGKEELIGYVPARAAVKSELYEQTVRKQTPRPKVRKKATCVNVDGNSKACKNTKNGTWILD